MVLAALVVLGELALPARALAADAATEQAKRYNAEAERLFNLGLFRQAAAVYLKAYMAKPVPEFLYNLGQCHRRLESTADLEKAIFYFESFLNNAPETPLRGEVGGEVASLRRELAARKHAAAHPPFYKRWWFWTLVGVAVTGATVGTVFALQPKNMEVVQGTLNPSPVQLP